MKFRKTNFAHFNGNSQQKMDFLKFLLKIKILIKILIIDCSLDITKLYIFSRFKLFTKLEILIQKQNALNFKKFLAFEKSSINP